jgi:hypothetical protein
MDHLASFDSATYAGSALVVPGLPVLTKKFTLTAGALLAGAVLGIVAGTPTAAAAAGNTGNGTIGTLSVGNGAKTGAWRLICIEPGSNLGTFAVEDPDGIVVGRAVVGSAYTGPIGFTIADGATDFVAGDSFVVTVPTSTDVKLAVAAATDGSAVPVAVLAHDADASAAEVEVIAYIRADVMESALSFGAGHTADTVREALRQRGITLVPSLSR